MSFLAEVIIDFDKTKQLTIQYSRTENSTCRL